MVKLPNYAFLEIILIVKNHMTILLSVLNVASLLRFKFRTSHHRQCPIFEQYLHL